MPTAEPIPDNIRRIAVLVSSVDSATARQLLLHLPTPIAKQVRGALQNLGPVSHRERQRILAEFQSTAAKQSPGAGANAATANLFAKASSPPSAQSYAGFENGSGGGAPGSGSAPNGTSGYQSPTASYSQPASLAQHAEYATYSAHSQLSHAEQVDASGAAGSSASVDASQPSWARMDIRALSHFLRSERSTVIAVVINQLSPNTGVALLQQLPASMHREVLQAIANLQDFDAEAMQAIEEHLSERLKDYELQISSEAKGTRRVAALLAAAPPDLQDTWSRFVHIAVDPSDESVSDPSASMSAKAKGTITTKQVVASKAAQFDVPEFDVPEFEATELEAAWGSHVVTTADASFTTRNTVSAKQTQSTNEEAYILPFPGLGELKPMSDVDRSLIQLEFEQILSLSPQQLAQVLTAANSHTVLLALAGASPSFMKRFYAMLNKSDARALAGRLSQIGPLKLREIDEAQRTISELAAKLVSARATSQRTSPPQSLRVAA